MKRSIFSLDMSKDFIKIIYLFLLTFLMCNEKINAQNELDVITGKWLQYSDAPNSLYHYLADQAYVMLAHRTSEITKLSSLSDWQQRQRYIHETLLDIVGPFPGKTPLNPKITRTINKESYRVEHIVFESQPGFYVTSSMFIPAGFTNNSKAPVVIYCSGHSEEGYRYAGYQQTILNLVNKGFIVFAFDPVGQGERLEYIDPKTGKSVFDGPTKEHSYPGSQVFTTGSSLASYMIWDGIRAVDYLLTRKEVDPARIGITGRSGGGTQSAFIAAMDNRIFAVAPECFITNLTRLIQTIGSQDAEQNLYQEIARGIDLADLLLVRAPKPALMITTTRDFFSIQGAMETEKEVSRIYSVYGMPGNFGRAEDDAPHESTPKNREALYAFFQKHLNNPGNPDDQKMQTLSEAEMQVTATGQVHTSQGGETVFSLNLKEAEKWVIKLQASRRDPATHQSRIAESAKKLSGYHEPAVMGDPVFTGRIQREGYVIEQYFVKGEGDYVIPYLFMIPDRSTNKALIYLHPSGKSAEASVGGEMEWFVRNGITVLAPDMIGVGETGPGDYPGDAFLDGISHNLWYSSLRIGRSIVGIRAGDVVRLNRILKSRSKIYEVYGFARKEMAPVLLHAAVFDTTIRRIALIEPYSSYASVATNRFYTSSFIYGIVPGAIRSYDLPDLEACLAPRKLLMAGTTDGSGHGIKTDDDMKDMAFIQSSYKYRKAEGKLSIVSLSQGEKLYDIFGDWIK